MIASETDVGNARYAFRVTHHDEVEPILASLRTAGCVLEDLQLQQADLEDVFLQIMGSSQEIRNDRISNAVLQRGAALLESRHATVTAPIMTAMMYLLIFGQALRWPCEDSWRELHGF